MALRFRIECCGGLVEQYDWAILDQRPGNRDALALAAGKLQTMLADRRMVARRESHDEVVGMRGLRRRDDFGVRGAELAERNVLADRTAEQMHDLADIGDLGAQ